MLIFITRLLTEIFQIYSFTSFFTFFQLSYECAVEARSGFLSYYSSLLDILVTDAPCVGLGDGTYKVCDF